MNDFTLNSIEKQNSQQDPDDENSSKDAEGSSVLGDGDDDDDLHNDLGSFDQNTKPISIQE